MASNSPVYSLRGICAYKELQIVVNEVGQVKRMVTKFYICDHFSKFVHTGRP